MIRCFYHKAETVSFSIDFSKNSQILNFIKIRLVGTEFFPCERMDRRNFAKNAYKNGYCWACSLLDTPENGRVLWLSECCVRNLALSNNRHVVGTHTHMPHVIISIDWTTHSVRFQPGWSFCRYVIACLILIQFSRIDFSSVLVEVRWPSS
jgi:hypothetical protein